VRALFLLAYTCSGFAGLVYEVVWTRLLTLYIGHTTAAASAVVAAFLGGLAVGAEAGGRFAVRWSRRQSLRAYIGLEIVVIVAAVAVPFELRLFEPVLASAYWDGAGGPTFAAIRILACLVMVFLPALALGATFPMAVRWFASETGNPARASGALYAWNTVGAAVGSLVAGFVLIPSMGLSRSTVVAIAGSVGAVIFAAILLRFHPGTSAPRHPGTSAPKHPGTPAPRHPGTPAPRSPNWLPSLVLGLSGFAALMHEIAWTRILALVLGPTIYAFSATLAAVVAGVALGSGVGAWIVGRTKQPAAWLAWVFAAAAITASYTYSLAGTSIPARVAREMAGPPRAFDETLWQGIVLTAALITPTSICLGAAFPLALSLVRATGQRAARRFAMVYAINTIGAVSGSLMAGFLFIPLFGLETTLRVVSASLLSASILVVVVAGLLPRARIGALAASGLAALLLVLSPPWDRELLASGVYMYAPFVPQDLDLETQLRAGTLLYYREGAATTVSVKRLTGTTTLAVDGKTDASNRGDMLTQKLVAHLPLLLHDNPRQVAVIGLGSGVTVGSALTHPVDRVDVIEIAPEVIDASRFFEHENHRALADPRTNLIIGDGRSHLLLSDRKYDVIISEPSNPWIAGVAALFTREFFAAARDRLTPDGVICQWANVYNISDGDLRAIVATFLSVFPEGTAWLVGADDLLLIAATSSMDGRLANIERHWTRLAPEASAEAGQGVAGDLALVDAREPFSLLSLFVGGPRELQQYAAGASIFTDDRMTLEFSAPREIHGEAAGANGETLLALSTPDQRPEVIRAAHAAAGAREWSNRAAMMTKRDAHTLAYEDYVRALRHAPADADTLDGFVRSAILTKRAADALSWIQSLTAGQSESAAVLVARSKLLAATGASADALDAARAAASAKPILVDALEQLASLYADAGDTSRLDGAVQRLREIAPVAAATSYYAAVSAFLRGNAHEAVRLGDAATRADSTFAPVHDVLGAAYTRLGQPDKARAAFLKSLALDAHDSTAYTNLGLIELAAGNRREAANYFAEALWLVPDSPTAREGLARARSPRE
jgi:spermidine synthase